MALKIDRKQLDTATSIAKQGMGGGVNYRISILASVLLVVLAGIFDILSLIPFVGDFIGPLFWIIASIYFWKIGMGLMNGRKLAVTLVSMAAEMVPVVQELPALMVGITVIIVMTRIEDKTGLTLNPMKKGVTQPRLSRNPFNSQPGVRPPRQKRKDNNVKNEADFPLDVGEIA